MVQLPHVGFIVIPLLADMEFLPCAFTLVYCGLSTPVSDNQFTLNHFPGKPPICTGLDLQTDCYPLINMEPDGHPFLSGSMATLEGVSRKQGCPFALRPLIPRGDLNSPQKLIKQKKNANPVTNRPMQIGLDPLDKHTLPAELALFPAFKTCRFPSFFSILVKAKKHVISFGQLRSANTTS